MTDQIDDLKKNIETLAKDKGQSPVEVISQLQSGAALVGDEALLDALCDLKWEYIE